MHVVMMCMYVVMMCMYVVMMCMYVVMMWMYSVMIWMYVVIICMYVYDVAVCRVAQVQIPQDFCALCCRLQQLCGVIYILIDACKYDL